MALNLTQHIGTLCSSPVNQSLTANNRPSTSASLWKPQRSTPMPILKCEIRPEIKQIDRATIRCRSMATADAGMPESSETQDQSAMGEAETKRGVPVYVMLPLDTVREGGELNRKKAMNASLMALKSAGTEGVMVDVWWGIVEKERERDYQWSGYLELFEMCSRIGLKVQAVMSFHQCGGNVGDSVNIPLPKWVVEEMEKDPELAYTDQWGLRNFEYVTLGCDSLPVLKGRTPIQCYSDFMCAFRDQFEPYLGSTIVEIQVGLGPAGELRYPAYPELNETWKFPGIGAFQCYDKYMLSSLKAAAVAAGKPEWGGGGPTDAGGYNNWPEDTAFFCREGGWNNPYGEFFLSWYSQMLLEHGERILTSTTHIFKSKSVKLSAKVAGIHWHYGTRSHASELTAGYYNTRFRDGYLPIARMFGRYRAVFNFTCIEMRDTEQPKDACCAPEGLVKQVAGAVTEAGAELAGENALPRYDETAHEQILQAALKGGKTKMAAFTYLRMGPDLFQQDNWQRFVEFVKNMGEGSEGERCKEQVEREAEQSENSTVPLGQEAAMALQSSN